MKKRKTLRNVLALLILLLVFGGAYLLLSGEVRRGCVGRGRQPIITESEIGQRVIGRIFRHALIEIEFENNCLPAAPKHPA